MARIFLSHSSQDNAQAVALFDWLAAAGWKDEIFVDFDRAAGIPVGDRFERSLIAAVSRCEAVLCLVTRAWLASSWCLREFHLAHRLNKRLFGILIEDLPSDALPPELTGTWQMVRLAVGRDRITLRGVLPITQDEIEVSFSAEGLARLRRGLEEAGLDPRYFAWPPPGDPARPPYRGLLPLEAEDAGIFFGRDAQIIEALDALRGLRERAPPRQFVILGASGAGKSSFLRAGLLPRLARDRDFLTLPVIRPERAVISGDSGLVVSLDTALSRAGIVLSRPDLADAVMGGAERLAPLLRALAAQEMQPGFDGAAEPKQPTLLLPIDQAEELYAGEAEEEARRFQALLRELLGRDSPPIIAALTIRSDSYERLQLDDDCAQARHTIVSLPPMRRGSYVDVVRGPARRLEETPRALEIEDALVDALLADVDSGSAKDALPLLSFTLARLYEEFHAGGRLELAHYDALGRMKGSIEAAVERALAATASDPRLPKDRATQLTLLRQGMIPWLAEIDPDTGLARRRISRLSEIPAPSRPLIEHLVDQRLVVADETQRGEPSVEPAHEALLRQWGQLQGWLAEDAGLLAIVESVRRAARDWDGHGREDRWLAHAADRLAAADRLRERPDLAAGLGPLDLDYLAACRAAEAAAGRRRVLVQSLIYTLLLGIIGGLLLWINQDYVRERINWVWRMRPYMLANFSPHVLAAATERALVPGDSFRECAKNCPSLIVIPPGRFLMGSPESERNRARNEGPRHEVTLARAFALSVYAVTFDEWDACVAVGGCRPVPDSGFGRGRLPVTNVTWDDAQTYVRWLSRMTGKTYRLPTEAEWEYAARAGTTTTYYWGDDLGTGHANCVTCGTPWDNRSPSPVGSFEPNPFGLYDMTGNVWQWVEDCLHPSYMGAPTDGSAWTNGDCSLRGDRGGSWISQPSNLRIAFRGSYNAGSRNYSLGIRVARTLDAKQDRPDQQHAADPLAKEHAPPQDRAHWNEEVTGQGLLVPDAEAGVADQHPRHRSAGRSS